MPKIALSYRRADGAAVAGRIFDRLVAHYGKNAVFMDIDSIPFGIDFRDHINNALSDTSILLAIVGPRWLSADTNAAPRIHDDTDFVRIEIETALQRKIPVVPLLIEKASMPSPSQLPESLRPFAFRNAAEVDIGRDFHSHMDRLIRSMDALLGQRPPEVVAAGLSGRTNRRPARRRMIIAASIVLAILGLGAAATYLPQVLKPAAQPLSSLPPQTVHVPAATEPTTVTGSPRQTLAPPPSGPLTSGEAVVLDGYRFYDRSGFNFRTEKIVGWNSLLGDILVANSNGGQGEASFYLPGVEGGVSGDNAGDVVKAGIVEIPGSSFSEVRSCPSTGYSHAWFRVRVGGVYCVVVRDGGSFAKVAVREILKDRIRFEWVYNPSGRSNF
jgi:hypothetical protein